MGNPGWLNKNFTSAKCSSSSNVTFLCTSYSVCYFGAPFLVGSFSDFSSHCVTWGKHISLSMCLSCCWEAALVLNANQHIYKFYWWNAVNEMHICFKLSLYLYSQRSLNVLPRILWNCFLQQSCVRYNGDVHDTIEPSTTHVVVADDDSPHLEEGSSTHCLQVKDRDCRSFLLV